MPGPVMAPRFLNVDLDIHSRLRLDAVVEYFVSEGAMVLAHGKHGPRRFFARIEAATEAAVPSGAIVRLCRLVEHMPPALRRRLTRCSLTLDVGLNSGTDAPALQFSLAPSLLRHLLALNVTLAFTVYPLSAEAGH